MADYTEASSLFHITQPLNRQKRSRPGAAILSCAECRRLKLSARCSRIFPCNNCVKKGCGAICPDGALTTGKGNRFVLANTETLHDKIQELSTRVRQLEDALAAAHGLLSTERHPLLAEGLLSIKRPLEREVKEGIHDPDKGDLSSDVNDEVDALGSLSISQSGRSSFFGATANSWYLLQNEELNSDDAQGNHTHEASWFNHGYTLGSSLGDNVEEIRSAVLQLLPPAPIAKRLSGIYFRHAAWMYNPIEEDDFYQTIFREIYGLSTRNTFDSHCVAVLYSVLALGSLMDLEEPANSHQATRYYHLGRTALSVDSIFEEQSIPAIQALLLMCHYMFLSGIESSRWVIMGIVVKLAQSVGLRTFTQPFYRPSQALNLMVQDRDSGKWNLGLDETQRRRSLMWEIYVYDSWQSLTFGRPPSLALAYIDCPMPEGTYVDASGELEMSFAAWKHRFSSQCLSVAHDRVFGAQTPSYKAVQEMDKKVRDYPLPPSLRVPGFGGSKRGIEIEKPTLQLTMQRYVAFAIREITLFYMHRGFFARAMEANSEDPLGSRFAPSVLAAYTSACSFVGLIESLFAQYPGLTERMFFLFSHVFSCAIVLGSIAVKRQMALAPSALSHLHSACQLFSQMSNNARAVKVLPILIKLRDRARTAAADVQPRRVSKSSLSMETSRSEHEFSSLGGMTRLISRRSSVEPSFVLGPLSLETCSAPAASRSLSPPSHYPRTPLPALHIMPPHQSNLEDGRDVRSELGFGEDIFSSQFAHLYGIPHRQEVTQGDFHELQELDFAALIDPPSNSGQIELEEAYLSPSLADPNIAWYNFVAQFRNV